MKTYQKILMWVGGIFLVLVVGGAIMDVADEVVEEAKAPVEESAKDAQVKSISDNEWQVMRTAYMINCNEDGDIEAYCNCTFDYLEKEFGRKGFYDIADDYSKSGEFSEAMVSATMACIDKY